MTDHELLILNTIFLAELILRPYVKQLVKYLSRDVDE
jgi:hypothetical protein